MCAHPKYSAANALLGLELKNRFIVDPVLRHCYYSTKIIGYKFTEWILVKNYIPHILIFIDAIVFFALIIVK